SLFISLPLPCAGPIAGGRRRLTPFANRERTQACSELIGELAWLQPPRPVARRTSGPVHPRLTAEADDVLCRDDRELRTRAERKLEQSRVRLGRIEAGRAARLRAQ